MVFNYRGYSMSNIFTIFASDMRPKTRIGAVEAMVLPRFVNALLFK